VGFFQSGWLDHEVMNECISNASGYHLLLTSWGDLLIVRPLKFCDQPQSSRTQLLQPRTLYTTTALLHLFHINHIRVMRVFSAAPYSRYLPGCLVLRAHCERLSNKPHFQVSWLILTFTSTTRGLSRLLLLEILHHISHDYSSQICRFFQYRHSKYLTPSRHQHHYISIKQSTHIILHNIASLEDPNGTKRLLQILTTRVHQR
jgi:hypothetical protein